MRKDTKTFLSTVLGIPVILGGVWGFNAASEASVVVYQREHSATTESEIPEPIEPPKEVIVVATATPAPVRPSVPVKIVAPPVEAPAPVVTPVAPTIVEPLPVEPAPKPVAEKKSRRTRAS